MEVYAWSIKDNDKLSACGVIVAKDREEAEQIVRRDWNIILGEFTYSIIPIRKGNYSVLQYREVLK